MQKYEKDNYRKVLTDSLLKEGKKLKVHYHVNKNRWALIDESKSVYGLFSTPEEIVQKVENGIIENADAFAKILKYRAKNKKENDSAKLFYMDTIYGKKGHSFRESLASAGALPGSEMNIDEVLGMFDDNTELPGATSPDSDMAQGKNVKPLNEMCEEEIYEMCESCYEEAMTSLKELYSACDYKDTRRMVFHEMYENMWENRKKTLEMVINKLREGMQGEDGSLTPAPVDQNKPM